MDMLLSDSDWESFSETDSTEDRDNFYGGQASCILSSLEETIGKIDEFLSFGREFLLGDIVCSITNPCGHMGRVVGIDMLVDLENSNGTVLKDIDSKKLSKIQSISIGDFVVSGSWLGRVDKVIDRVNIVFDNGGKCGITVMDPDELVPIITPNMFEDSQYPYYPGQRVMVKHSSSIFRSSRRVFGPWKDNQDEGTVCSTEAGIVYVDWLTSILSGSSSLPSPNSLQDPKNLTLLSCYSHENWQLGDWCILPNEEKNAILREDFGNEHNKLEISGEIFIITKMKSKVDVIWQDGSYSSRLDSQALLPSNFVNSHEFWPGQFVLEKGIFEDARIALSHRWGVVEAFDSKEKIVKVRWRRVPEGEFNDVNGHCLEETMSAYELVEHPDYSFCFGDVVFKLDRNKYGDLDEDKDHQDEYLGKYLSCIGSVTGFKDGVVEVRWASGSSTKVAPFEIFRVDQSEGSTSTPAVYEENVDELRQDATQCEKQSLTQNGKELMSFDSAGKSCEKHSRECHLSCLPEAAIGFLSSIATSLFGSLGLTSLSTCHHICKDETENKILLQGEEKMEETCDTNFTESYELSTNLEEFKTTSFNQTKAEEVSENKECSYSLFKRFDMISDCSDHHFIGAGMSPTSSQIRRCWLKKVHEEWNILEKNLPETIFVRVYEERMDLMRAAIIGAPGTPYHDGIFFFDILLPPEYPHEPPSVHYISGGLRANPNLYESGKVCLSLLNTWTGTGNEVWNPKSSTILQVLLSLQALVLNEKPYFNEAGYDKQVGREEGEKNSVSYNENAFLVTCKSMLYLLSKPPKHFELFVEQHFRHRSEPIIQACRAYMKGTAVGCACYRYEDETGENDCETSMGFKIMLGKIVPKLIEVFTVKEIDCTKFSGPEN